MWDTWVRSLGQEDPLEKEIVTHSSTLAWRIPWMEEPGGLQPTGSQRIRPDWATSLTHSLRCTQTHYVTYRDCQFSTFHFLILLSKGPPLSLELVMDQLKDVFSTLYQVRVDLILANEMSIGVVQRNFYEYQKWERAWELLSALLSFLTLLTSNLTMKTGASAARLHHEAIMWEDFWAKCGKE